MVSSSDRYLYINKVNTGKGENLKSLGGEREQKG